MPGIAVEITHYDQLIQMLNERRCQLELTCSELDERSGMVENYCSKIFRDARTKKIGPVSFAMFGALGVRLFVLQDEKATARTLERRVPRQASRVHPRKPKEAANVGA